MTQRKHFDAGDALLIVDVQNDFCSDGALPIPGGEAVVPVLNKWIARMRAAGCPVFASRDWHPIDHVSFSHRGGPWPVHCVQDSEGAQFHPPLAIDEDTILISKGTRFDQDAYSAFDNTGLADYLRGRGIERLWLGGLALDVCVRHTALDAVDSGFETHLIRSACRAVDALGGDQALRELRDAGVLIDD